ncbi:MAG: HmuY family protein [Myxococcota bacterium]
MSLPHRLLAACAALAVLPGCVQDLALLHHWDDAPATPPTPPAVDPDTSDTAVPLATGTTEIAAGVWSTEVDATDAVAWVAVDLDGRGEQGPRDGSDWDVALRRYDVAVNGGASGDGGVEVLFVPDVSLTDLGTPPSSGFTTDAPDVPDDDDEEPEHAMADWYAYDSTSHVLTPHPGTWVIRSTRGRTWVLAFHSYYDDAGTSAVVTFHWTELTPRGTP